MATFEQIIARWDGPAAFGRAAGMSLGAAKQVRRRGSIPSEYWNALVETGKTTLAELADAAEARRLAQAPSEAGAAA